MFNFRMLLHSSIKISYILLLVVFSIDAFQATQDQTTSRPNTLYDDADDIQRQLDNEARDKMIYGKPKTVWVFRLPTNFHQTTTESWLRQETRHSRKYVSAFKQNVLRKVKKLNKTKKPAPKPKSPVIKDWCYKHQNEWFKMYPQCGGRSQSPVDLPVKGLVKATDGRHLCFINYHTIPRRLHIKNDGKRIAMYGEWVRGREPVVYGGAAHSRRYIFYSMILHWPSEHRVEGFQYPLETQAIHISAEYKTLDEALKASPRDPLALLGIVNLYTYKNYTHSGLEKLLNAASEMSANSTAMNSHSLAHFNPPLKEYACYQGSLTAPPCTESVLWMVRARALAVTREAVDFANNLLGEGKLRGTLYRQPQPLNDRKVFYFN